MELSHQGGASLIGQERRPGRRLYFDASDWEVIPNTQSPQVKPGAQVLFSRFDALQSLGR